MVPKHPKPPLFFETTKRIISAKILNFLQMTKKKNDFMLQSFKYIFNV